MRSRLSLTAVAAVAVLAGCGSTAAPAQQPGPVPARTEASLPQTSAAPEAGGDAAPPRITTTDLNPAPIGGGSAPIEASRPVRVSVPGVGIDAPLVELGLDAAGAVAAPADFDTAGWYTGSAQPGQPGPAVLAGHVDSRSGPAAFYRLVEVAVGDDITVHREDGSALTFTVTGVEQYAKDAVPTQAIYGPTPGPQLRLITCGGDFDRSIGHYEDNVVVYATI